MTGARGSTRSDSPPAGSTAGFVYGDPSAVSLRVVEQTARHMVLELRTDGFSAQLEADGSVRLSVPGFAEESAPGAPAIPVKRGWIEVASRR